MVHARVKYLELLCLPGDSGSLVFIADGTIIQDGNSFKTLEGPQHDLLVGIMSYASFSAPNDGGAGGILISSIRDFIDDVIPNKVQIGEM